MDAESIHDIKFLLRRCDEEQAAFEATHLTGAPKTEPKKIERMLTEKEVDERIMKKLEAVFSALGAEIGQIEARIRKEFQIALGELRAEITVSSSNGKGVVDLGKWRNDAA
jgi:hypothetical protein